VPVGLEIVRDLAIHRPDAVLRLLVEQFPPV
jgi:hypothetical protein